MTERIKVEDVLLFGVFANGLRWEYREIGALLTEWRTVYGYAGNCIGCSSSGAHTIPRIEVFKNNMSVLVTDELYSLNGIEDAEAKNLVYSSIVRLACLDARGKTVESVFQKETTGWSSAEGHAGTCGRLLLLVMEKLDGTACSLGSTGLEKASFHSR